MIKILQFGEGNFLRTFVDLYFETLNQEGYGPYEVNILKPITFGNLAKFYKQNNKYHIILRGNKNNKTVEDVYQVNSVKHAIENFNNDSYVFTLIKDKDLKNTISNNCLNGFSWNKNIIDSANALIVELTINNISGYESDKTPTTSKGSHWQSFDAGLSALTFCLAAHDIGIGSVIMGIYDEQAVKKVLNLDDKYSVSALIAIGYHEQNLPAPQRVDVDEFLTIK